MLEERCGYRMVLKELFDQKVPTPIRSNIARDEVVEQPASGVSAKVSCLSRTCPIPRGDFPWFTVNYGSGKLPADYQSEVVMAAQAFLREKCPRYIRYHPK